MTEVPHQNGQALATTAPKRSVLVAAADRFNMEPEAFEATLRGTVFPPSGTKAEFAAFLVVANEYGLNPVTREIYAYPKKGGGIQPIVSIDGWARIINEHPQFDGMDFAFEDLGGDQSKVPGSLGGPELGCTVTIWRKDRTKPIVITEYLSECYRNTDPWKMRRRMLRHKTLIQGARYAFGFASIMDEDEAMAVVETLTPVNEPAAAPQKPPRASRARSAGFAPKGDDVTAQAAQEPIDAQFEHVDPGTGEVIETRPQSGDAVTQSNASADQASGQSGASASVPAEKTGSATGAGSAPPASTQRTAPLGSDKNPPVTPAEALAAGTFFHVQSDPINASGQRPFYDEDGNKRGWATEAQGLRVATDTTGAKTTTWAPQVDQQQAEAATDDAPWDADDSGRDEAPRSPWDVFDAVLMSSSDWGQIRSAMGQLARDPVWNEDAEAKLACRVKTFARAKALGIDPAKDATAFQCFLFASNSAADIAAIYGDAMREEWFTKMDAQGQASVGRLVMSRTKELG